jgi:hypothetical protein
VDYSEFQRHLVQQVGSCQRQVQYVSQSPEIRVELQLTDLCFQTSVSNSDTEPWHPIEPIIDLNNSPVLDNMAHGVRHGDDPDSCPVHHCP